MSTRCVIAKYEDSTSDVKYIECRYDGYLDGVGAILEDQYKEYELIDELLELGNIKTLGLKVSSCEIEDEHLRYDTQIISSNLFYLLNIRDSELIYIFIKDAWYYASIRDAKRTQNIHEISFTRVKTIMTLDEIMKGTNQ